MRKFLAFFLIFIILAMFVSCQNDFHQNSGNYGTNEDTNTNSDTNTDLNTDTNSNENGDSDTSTDNDTDSNNDVTSTDTETSTNTDTSTDVSTDTDTSTDVSTDTDTSTDVSTDTDTSTDTDDIAPDLGDEDPSEPDPIITMKDENGLVYGLKSDDTLKVVTYEGNPGHVTIPRSYNSYTVTEIGENAFKGYGKKIANVQLNIGFVTILIPDTVTKIGKGAFSDCSDVKTLLSTKDATMTAEEWISIVVIEEGNDHVADVVLYIRPAIGWKKFVKP